MLNSTWSEWNVALIAVVTLCLLACNPGTKTPREPEASAASTSKQVGPSETTATTITLKKKERREKAEAQRVEGLLNASGQKVKRSEKIVTAERLKTLGASSYQTYVSQDPELHVFIFNYGRDLPTRKSILDVVLWVNESGLVHNAEAAMARDKIVAIGFPTTDPPTEEMLQARNDLMDSVVAGR